MVRPTGCASATNRLCECECERERKMVRPTGCANNDHFYIVNGVFSPLLYSVNATMPIIRWISFFCQNSFLIECYRNSWLRKFRYLDG